MYASNSVSMPKGHLRTAIYILVIAGFAALTSGSCTHWTYSDVDEASYDNGMVESASAAAISALVASSLAGAFLLAWYSPGRLVILTGTSVAAYAAVLQGSLRFYLVGLLGVVWDGILLLACCVLLVVGIGALRSGLRQVPGAMLIIGVSLLGGLTAISGSIGNHNALAIAGLGVGIFLIACLMLVAAAMAVRQSGSRGALAAMVINALPTLGFLAVIKPLLEGADDINAFFLSLMLVLACWALFVFVMTALRSGFQRALGAMVVSGLAALGGFAAIFIGALMNYEICIGFFGTSCPEPEPMDIFPFALIAGGVPLVVAAVAARLVGDWYRPAHNVNGADPEQPQSV